METYTIQEALSLLNQGYICIMVENKTMVRFLKGMYALSGQQWHTRMNEDDFLQVFKDNTFIVYEDTQGGISAEKDEEYYAWRQMYL